MENRLRIAREEPEEKHRPAGDYFQIQTRGDVFYVSAETARRIGRVLDRRWRPRWVKFVDLNGARAWVRTDQVEAVHESTEAGRQTHRDFNRALRREDRTDRRWDEDEF
ncbi:MAG TPA: hypothetical protein VFX98_10570 [Longimicrobiaceae bacterium]|nr:hypothetical protein [Longimicrobiaceae bacterium]